MPLRTLIPIVLYLLAVGSANVAVAQDGGFEPFTMTTSFSSFDGEVAQDAYFFGHYAVTTDGGAPWIVYDLDALAWRDRVSEIEVSAQRCREWAQDSAQKTRASAERRQNASVAAFALSLIEPDFEVTVDGSDLVLSNDFLNYRVESAEGLTPAQRRAVHAYGRIDACYKAMTRRDLPPFPELALIDVLDSKKAAPGRVMFKIDGGGQHRTQIVTYTYSDLSSEHAARLMEMLD